MKRIAIIGSPGAGKSYLSRTLADLLGLPLYHLDQMFWQEGWVEKGRAALMTELEPILLQEKWIIDGMYRNTLDLRLHYADTLIYLDYSYIRCLWGVIKRTVTSLGRVRPDMADGCPERFDTEFIKYIGIFHREHRPLVEEIIKPYKENGSVQLLRFKHPKDVAQWLKTIA